MSKFKSHDLRKNLQNYFWILIGSYFPCKKTWYMYSETSCNFYRWMMIGQESHNSTNIFFGIFNRDIYNSNYPSPNYGVITYKSKLK